MGNTISSSKAQQRIGQIQTQLQNEYSALSTELYQMVSNIKQVGHSSRSWQVTMGPILGLIFGFLLIAIGGSIRDAGIVAACVFSGLVFIGVGILIAYYYNKYDANHKTAIDNAASTLEKWLIQNWPNK